MKNTIFLSIALLFMASMLTAQVAINTTGANPDASAMLDVKATNKGLLIPRMTEVQKNAISSPAIGLMVFQTDGDAGIYINNPTAAGIVFWTKLAPSYAIPPATFGVSGNNIYSLYSSGNVGIGTSTPQTKLDVLTESNSFGLQIGDANNKFLTVHNSYGNIIGSKYGPMLGFDGSYYGAATNAPRMGLMANGNLGLGPFYTGWTPATRFTVNTEFANTVGFEHTADEVRLGSQIINSVKGGGFGTISNTPLLFFTNGAGGANNYYPKMKIMPDGKVGIGQGYPSWDPATQLTVLTTSDADGFEQTNGDIRFATHIYDNTYLGGAAIGTLSNHRLSFFTNLLKRGGFSAEGRFQLFGLNAPAGTDLFSTFSNNVGYMGLFDNTTLGFGSPLNSGVALKMNLTDGKTSIGSTSISTPGNYRLYVSGGILTEKVKVAVMNSGSWADYVFAENYQLRPLEEVEDFVKKEKHLPGVPSADEMVESGLDMAKMDAKLLEKIEELTLYLIDLKKENEANRKENEALKARLEKLERGN